MCPYCGKRPPISQRRRPEQVEGDLLELDPATLAEMRGEIDRIDGPPMIPAHLGPAAAGGLKARWSERQKAQIDLRNMIALWAGMHHAQGASDHEIYRRFYWRFGTDIMTAQTFGRPEAESLTASIHDAIGN